MVSYNSRVLRVSEPQGSVLAASRPFAKAPLFSISHLQYCTTKLLGLNHHFHGMTSVESNRYKSIFTYSQSSITLNVGSIASETRDGRLSRLFTTVTTLICYITFAILLPWSLWFCLKRVQQYERIVAFRMGRLQEIKGPGWILLFPMIDNWHRVDVRTKAFLIPPQQILLCDGAVVEVGAEIHFRISDIVRSVMFIKKLDESTRTLGKVTVANKLRELDLYDLQNKSQNLESALLNDLNETTLLWGLEISRVALSPAKVLFKSDQLKGIDALMPCLHAVAANIQKQTLHVSSEDAESIFQLLSTTLREVIETPSDGEIKASCHIEISGENGSHFWFVEGGKLMAGKPSEKCDVHLLTSLQTLKSLLNNTLSPLQAFVSGRIQVTGDKMILMKILNKRTT